MWRRNVPLDRLVTATDVFRLELSAVRSRAKVDEAAAPGWRADINSFLALASRDVAARRIDAGSEALQGAEQLTSNELSSDELEAVVVTRRAEIQKLSGWRSEVALELLDPGKPDPPEPGRKVSTARLFEATRILNEHSSNVHLKLRLGRVAFPIAAGQLVAILIGLGATVW